MPDVIYACDRCSAQGVKLWRPYGGGGIQLTLLCFDCVLQQQGPQEDWRPSGTPRVMVGTQAVMDQHGTYVAAIPVPGSESFYGYSAVPDDMVLWWWTLPPTSPEVIEHREGVFRSKGHHITGARTTARTTWDRLNAEEDLV